MHIFKDDPSTVAYCTVDGKVSLFETLLGPDGQVFVGLVQLLSQVLNFGEGVESRSRGKENRGFGISIFFDGNFEVEVIGLEEFFS